MIQSVTVACRRTLPALVVLTLATACGGSSKPAATPAPPATSATTPVSAPATTLDPTAKAGADALSTYQNMIKAVTQELDTNVLSPDVFKYAGGDAYALITGEMSRNIQNNIIFTGTPQSAPVVTATNLTGSVPTVTIRDCFGGPGVVPVFAADDKAGHKKGQSALVAGAVTVPHPVTATVVLRSGVWKVEVYTPDPKSPC